MILSDALSRQPDHCPEEEVSEETILLPDTFFLNILDTELQDQILNANKYNFDVLKAMDGLKNKGMNGLQKDLEDWTVKEKDGKRMLFYQGRNYVPKDDDLRQDILKLHHDHETAGHPGELEMFNLI